jgi:aerobic C4-dicarboxylate transport protein
MPTPIPAPDSPAPRPKRFYQSLWVQVTVAIALAIVFGYLSPKHAVAMKPLGDAFIRLITMLITVMIFCTVVTGIAGMRDLRKVGRVGGKALLYFEIISTLGLAVGLIVGNVVQPGSGFNVDAATLDARAVADYAGQAKTQTVTDFLMHIIPTTIVDAFAKGDILEVVLVSILFGAAMSVAGSYAKPLVDMLESLSRVVFRMVDIVMRVAPIGAFLHDRQIRLVFTRSIAETHCVILDDIHPVRSRGLWRGGVARWLQPDEVSEIHQGRNSAGAGD